MNKEIQRKKYMSKTQLEEYENLLSSFLQQKKIEEGSNIFDIVKKLGYELQEKEKLENGHEAEKINTTIYIDKNLSYKEKNFGIAHEIAHDVRGDVASAARATHTFRLRSIEEQICDYIAAALILPYADMKKRLDMVNYESISRKDKIRFITALADEKNISEEVVIRRINEIRVLVSK